MDPELELSLARRLPNTDLLVGVGQTSDEVGTLGAIYVVVGILALWWLDPGAHLQINGMVLEISRQSRPAGDHLVVWPLSFQVKLADRSQEIEAQRRLKEYKERMEVLEALQQRDRRPGLARNNQ